MRLEGDRRGEQCDMCLGLGSERQLSDTGWLMSPKEAFTARQPATSHRATGASTAFGQEAERE